MKKLRPIAIHLPQFHPIPENDKWWGNGFTEWTNVTKAKPLFKGHYQPHLPADLGFYDLRLPEARQAQADLAREYGIYGFCYYHYWFNGRRILERPLNEILSSEKPDFPFCICWANENWTKTWDGSHDHILLEQKYDFEDDRKHMEYLCRKVFCDSRYIKIDGKPLFIVYRTQLFPDINKTADIWREVAQKEGVGDIYLARMESFMQRIDPGEIGFDAAVEFQPDWVNRPKRKFENAESLLRRLKLNIRLAKNNIYSYEEFVEKMIKKPRPAYKCYPGIMPGWDNSARRTENAAILTGSTPDLFGKWLHHIINDFEPFSREENFFFINAWNEWAEGNHLEPDQRWGKGYLEKIKISLDILREKL